MGSSRQTRGLVLETPLVKDGPDSSSFPHPLTFSLQKYPPAKCYSLLREYACVNVTCRGCLDSAILSHIMLNEKLNIFGVLGALLCILGSVTIVLHAPEERQITSLLEVWHLARQPGMLYLPSVEGFLCCCCACQELRQTSCAAVVLAKC